MRSRPFEVIVEDVLANAEATMATRHRTGQALQLKKSVHEEVDTFLELGDWAAFKATMKQLIKDLDDD